MREIVEARGSDYVPPASALERRFMQVIRDGGLPEMLRQVDVGGSEWTGRVDFRDRTLPLVLEVQSERYHSALVDVVADRRRRAELEEAGWLVVEVWDTELWHEPRVVQERVRAARSALLAVRRAG